jgi:transcriptional regulator with XRE-family HTH domain
MSGEPLNNYLRMHRSRHALTQADVAFLVGAGSAATIARYESGRRTPSLEVVLAFEALFGVPAEELFAGTFQTVEKSVGERACQLVDVLRSSGVTPETTAKLRHLMELCSRLDLPQS